MRTDSACPVLPVFTSSYVGEAVVPGASLLMDGNILSGGAHLVVGGLARMALGPVGLVLVVANSYSKSTTGKSLLQQFTK